MVFHMDNYLIHIDESDAKWINNNKIKVLECTSQSPDAVQGKSVVSVNKDAYKPQSLMIVLLGALDQNYSKLLWEAFRYSTYLTQVSK